MKRRRNMCWHLVVLFGVAIGLQLQSTNATDFEILSAKNWDQLVPQGKEVDAIYGDYVLKNDKIVAVIAKPSPLRNANLTIRNVGGFVLDLTSVSRPNDQLGCYFPLGGRFHFHSEKKASLTVDGKKGDLAKASGKSIKLVLVSSTGPEGEVATLTYELQEGATSLTISHSVSKGGSEVTQDKFVDAMRADRVFSFSTTSEKNLFLANDDWFGQCYGIYYANGSLKRGKQGVSIEFENTSESTTRQLLPADSLLAAKGLASNLAGQKCSSVELTVADPRGKLAHAKITIQTDKGQAVGTARTKSNGTSNFLLSPGKYRVAVEALGQEKIETDLNVGDSSASVALKFKTSPPVVAANITGPDGEPIPCKVAFFGKNGTKDPDFGPDAAANPVKNLFYSYNGKFQQDIPAGEYDIIVSRGPEYDAEFLSIKAENGKETSFQAKLKRVVKTPGWVSTEYHSHSSPSGDNISDQRGRVLNLLGEQLEFAPCTEHQRVDSYMPHITAMNAEQWLATCSGMELTGSPLPLNHQNAFPLVHKPRTQDGGGPRIDADPVVQIERLAYWDNKSEKLVQSNHPNLLQMAGDANLDGKVDGGFRKMFDFMDVMEVHPPQSIFSKPDSLPSRGRRGNVIFNWMQLLNHGYRIVGVVNTDAHYNFHGSGWLRNYVRSSTDEPGKIKTMEMVRNSKKGHVVMTTGPYLSVKLTPSMSEKSKAVPGDDIAVPSGKASVHVSVQCPNWLDVNRVQVFINGEAKPELNFTRRANPKDFRNGVVKFDKQIEIELKQDAHIIVATIGEGLKLGRVMGPRFGEYPPCAVANPIFVDVDGKGFQPSFDKIGSPFLIEKK